MDKKPITAYIISWFLAPAIIITCTDKVPFFWPRLYGTKWFFRLPDNHPENLIIIVVLIFIVFLFFAMRGSIRARLVWLGFLLNFMYIFILYSLPIFRNNGSLFLIVYGFLFIITIIAFVDGMKSLNPETIAEGFSKKTPRKITATFFVLSILVVLIMLFFWALKPFFRNVPITNYYISLVALSVLLIIPLYLAAIYMLIKNRPLGYVLSLILLIWGSIPIMNFIALKSAYFWDFIYLIPSSFKKDLITYFNYSNYREFYSTVGFIWFIAEILVIIHPFVSLILAFIFLENFKNADK